MTASFNKEYFDKSVERFENHVLQQPMFKDYAIKEEPLDQSEMFKN